VNIRAVLEFRLKQEGYTVLATNCSTQALEQAKTEQPDLIIVDLAEPHEDGLEFLERLRTRPECAGIPIFALSTFREEELESTTMDLRNVEFLLKPFSPRELVADVHRIVSSQQTGVKDVGQSRSVQASNPATSA
jgi:DNA-binding response OmpR family regulator